MASEALTGALNDAGIPYATVRAAVCGYCYGDPTSGTVTMRRVQINSWFAHVISLIHLMIPHLVFPLLRSKGRVPCGHDGDSNHEHQQQLQHR
jgi:hypothetical protein